MIIEVQCDTFEVLEYGVHTPSKLTAKILENCHCYRSFFNPETYQRNIEAIDLEFTRLLIKI